MHERREQLDSMLDPEEWACVVPNPEPLPFPFSERGGWVRGEGSNRRATISTVLPITHTAATDDASAVEVPAPVKRHLGLDDHQSWIVVAEGNEFAWPGYDLRRLLHTDHYAYGFLPPRFFNRVIEAFLACHRAGRRRRTRRD